MDGPGEHYAKWNKPFRERQIPYDFTHMWNVMNKLTSKIERDSSKENRFDSYGVGLGGQGIEQKGKKIHRHGQQCGDCWG